MTRPDRAVLECRGLTVRVPGRELVRELHTQFLPGTVTAVLGRNGAGKSSLLHVLAGLATPAAGEVLLAGRPLAAWPRRDLARRLGLLTQSSEDPFPGTALETALVGRHPHLDFWQWETDADLAVARRCLAEMDLAGLESRDVATLSGGGRPRHRPRRRAAHAREHVGARHQWPPARRGARGDSPLRGWMSAGNRGLTPIQAGTKVRPPSQRSSLTAMP